MEAKQQILKAMEELPDDAGVEEALDRLYLLYKVDCLFCSSFIVQNSSFLHSTPLRANRFRKWVSKFPARKSGSAMIF